MTGAARAVTFNPLPSQEHPTRTVHALSIALNAKKPCRELRGSQAGIFPDGRLNVIYQHGAPLLCESLTLD